MLWPARRKQELLLDLGERKRWTGRDAEEAVARLTAWLVAELGVPETVQPFSGRGIDLAEARRLAVAFCEPGGRSTGVARDLVALEPVVGGSSPKALDEELVGVAQFGAALAACRRVPTAAGRCVALLTLEAALTQAHLVPHAARRSGDSARPGDRWLPLVQAALDRAWLVDLVGDEAAVLLTHRVARMRAYRDGDAPPPAPGLAHPHLVATALVDGRQTARQPTSLSLDDRGGLMLAPQLRAKGLLQEEPG